MNTHLDMYLWWERIINIIKYNMIILQVASLATLALLLAAIGGSDMSLQYIFVIHVYLGMHQSEVYELWIVSG